MRAHVTLQPGQKGTKKLLAEYGDQLVCVRYRDDKASRRQLKTVELIVEERPWGPELSASMGAARVGVPSVSKRCPSSVRCNRRVGGGIRLDDSGNCDVIRR